MTPKDRALSLLLAAARIGDTEQIAAAELAAWEAGASCSETDAVVEVAMNEEETA